MIELGKIQTLEVVKFTDFGAYLSEDKSSEEKVLLPIKQVPQSADIGSKVEVFVYRDSKDRLISTTNMPLITLGKAAKLKVNDVTSIGAFLDWGLEKDLFLSFKEQTTRVKPGQSYMVALYIDKSNRLAATMKVYKYLPVGEGYEKDQVVTGTVYELSDTFGAFVAVDDMYQGLIHKKEIHTNLSIGDTIEARITAIREDGKIDLGMTKKAYLQMDEDAEKIMTVIEEFDGVLPFNDKASPEVIEREFGMSKAAFKRAVGRLYKARKIEIGEKSIRIINR
ncbi:MAG: S1 RNA-binding domain-containing protein [Lachnospiraceae bacterium]|nr:S1 RNA-binding domain-containing protein [Lachnospiraceae bacterium]